MPTACFHCGEPIPKGFDHFVAINNISQPMCCVGCEAVAQTIVDNHLTHYYQYRTEPAKKSTPLVPDELTKLNLLDDLSLQGEFTYVSEQGTETILSIEGISCAACAWLIEMQLAKLSGINKVTVNATTQRASITWQPEQLKLSKIIDAISHIGYQAHPFKANDVEHNHTKQSKTFIRRLGISGILMMQVLMIAIGLYFGAFSGMSTQNLVYLQHISLFLTLPVVTYGAWPFYQSAYTSLKFRHLSMDVPVTIAIILSFGASAWATLQQHGEVYFESVTMFTFLLLIGKFLEFRARSRAALMSSNLLKLMPLTATKLIDGNEYFITAKQLQKNDLVLIKPGETVPADGIIIQGESQINEAMLTGEQKPMIKQVNDQVYAGTINNDGNLIINVNNDVNQCFLTQLIRLSEQAQAHKPKISQISDRIAQYFVALILLFSILTAVYWLQHDASQAFWITVSVLVATCPCALSLATPTALTCATIRLNKAGILIKAAHVMETIPKINCFAFDKTGTLTTGKLAIKSVINLIPTQYTEQQILTLIAALEAHSEHPIAKAFLPYRDFSTHAEQVVVKSGDGIDGHINGHYYQVGKPSWLLTTAKFADYGDAHCVLTEDSKLIAVVYLADQLKAEAPSVIKALHKQQINSVMLSGDNPSVCQQVAQATGIKQVHSQLSATDKLTCLEQIQQQHITAMVGDGVNDSPVFGAAHVAIAMGSGTDIAKSNADVIFLNSDLENIITLRHIAKKTKKIMFQNYGWAFAYNIIVLPLAMMGHITPYFAVIGMSASSILVVTNSLRLLKK